MESANPEEDRKAIELEDGTIAEISRGKPHSSPALQYYTPKLYLFICCFPEEGYLLREQLQDSMKSLISSQVVRMYLYRCEKQGWIRSIGLRTHPITGEKILGKSLKLYCLTEEGRDKRKEIILNYRKIPFYLHLNAKP